MVGHDGFAVELGEQDVGDGPVDVFGGVLEEVGEADVEAAFAEADGGVERREAAETDVHGRHGSARTEFAVLDGEGRDEGGGNGGKGSYGHAFASVPRGLWRIRGRTWSRFIKEDRY